MKFMSVVVSFGSERCLERNKTMEAHSTQGYAAAWIWRRWARSASSMRIVFCHCYFRNVRLKMAVLPCMKPFLTETTASRRGHLTLLNTKFNAERTPLYMRMNTRGSKGHLAPLCTNEVLGEKPSVPQQPHKGYAAASN